MEHIAQHVFGVLLELGTGGAMWQYSDWQDGRYYRLCLKHLALADKDCRG